jgi:hypothetical protein
MFSYFEANSLICATSKIKLSGTTIKFESEDDV